MIVAGIDPCFSCNDRMVVVNQQGLIWEDLRQYSIDYYQKRMI